MSYSSYGNKKKRKPIYDETLGEPPTEDQIVAMTKQAKNVANWWLEQSQKSRKEIFDKIKNKDITDDVANQVLDDYEERGYIDDRKFAESFIYSKTTYEKLGKQAIKYKLIQKGVASHIIEETLAEVEDEALEENARLLAERKLKSTVKYEPYKRVQNIAAHLMRKGYNGGLAFKLAKEVVEEATKENLDITEE